MHLIRGVEIVEVEDAEGEDRVLSWGVFEVDGFFEFRVGTVLNELGTPYLLAAKEDSADGVAVCTGGLWHIQVQIRKVPGIIRMSCLF